MARISAYAELQADPTSRCRTRDLRRIAVFASLAVVVLAGCQPDSDSITGVDKVDGTLDHHPERQSCHFAPEAITTVEGSDEVVLIEFEYGGGETWSTCHPNPDSITGVLLAADGVSYSDSVGGDGDFLALAGCEYSQGDCAYNVPSPINAVFIDHLLGSSGYLRFDPPISEISFMVCSSQSHGLTAWDSLGNLVVPETVGPTTADPCAPEDWVPFGIESPSGEHNISRVRLRRWDPGLTWWDDMTFRREAPPGIECDTVTRGSPATCSVTDPTGVTSVVEWRFEGFNEEGEPLAPVVNTMHDSLAWRGDVVASGSVSATLVRDGDTTVVVGALEVEPREWRWSEDDPNGAQERRYFQGGGQECVSWQGGTVDQHGDPIGTVVYAQNTTAAGFGSCGHYLLPDPAGQDGYEIAPVQGGPNEGLYYVISGSWHIRRGSLINPFFLQGGPTQVLTKKPQQKACGGSTTASFWDYNESCENWPLDNFIQGLWNHEGVGSLGPDAPEPNGHWGRVEQRAKEPAGDPYRAMETIVDDSIPALRDRVRFRALDVENELDTAADGQLHIYVRDNFCGLVFMYNAVQGRYDLVTPLQTGGFCI